MYLIDDGESESVFTLVPQAEHFSGTTTNLEKGGRIGVRTNAVKGALTLYFTL